MASPTAVFEVRIMNSAYGQSVTTVQHWAYDVPPGAPTDNVDVDELAAEIDARWSTIMQPRMPDEWRQGRIQVTELITTDVPLVLPNPLGFDIGYVVQSADNFGDEGARSATDFLPLYNTANVVVRTTASGKRFTGRFKYSPIAEDEAVDNQMDAAPRAALKIAFDGLTADFTAAGGGAPTFVYGVLSKTTGLALPDGTPARNIWRERVQTFVEPIIGSLRSRKFRIA